MRLEAISVLLMAAAAVGQDCQGWIKRSPPHTPGQLRPFQVMAYDAEREVCVLTTGKPDPLNCVSETWLWDGDDWSLASDQYPCVEDGAAMVFDSTRDVAVHYGGSYGNGFSYSDETWEWNGTAWNWRGFGPPGRIRSGMAYDAARQVTILFGGLGDDHEPMDGTWAWNGAKWSILKVDGPDAVAAPSMAFDAARGVIVLHGGSPFITPTWEWDGLAWNFRTAFGPAKAGASMVYLPDRQVCFLFGGNPGDQTGQESWEWDGEVWTKLNTPVKPPPVQGAPMAYDNVRHAVVLYTPGGESWEYLCEPPPCYPDLDGNGVLDLFDFLAFVNSFNAGDTGPSDCDHNGDLDLFDFLCYTNAFNAGC